MGILCAGNATHRTLSTFFKWRPFSSRSFLIVAIVAFKMGSMWAMFTSRFWNAFDRWLFIPHASLSKREVTGRECGSVGWKVRGWAAWNTCCTTACMMGIRTDCFCLIVVKYMFIRHALSLSASAKVPSSLLRGLMALRTLGLAAFLGRLQYAPVVLRACPREDQAGVAHAISPIFLKLGLVKGFTQKPHRPKPFDLWIFPSEYRPPPLVFQGKPLKPHQNMAVKLEALLVRGLFWVNTENSPLLYWILNNLIDRYLIQGYFYRIIN